MAVTAFLVASVVTAVLTAGDMLRRPESDWVAADRERSWWVSMTFLLGLIGCGIFIAIVYGVGVLPRFGQHQPADDSFSKVQRGGPARATLSALPTPPIATATVRASGSARPAGTPPARGEDGRLIVEFDDL